MTDRTKIGLEMSCPYMMSCLMWEAVNDLLLLTKAYKPNIKVN